jgi:hypothetical protein
VHLDGGLGGAKASPREHRQAEVDRGGVESVETVLSRSRPSDSPAYIGRAM